MKEKEEFPIATSWGLRILLSVLMLAYSAWAASPKEQIIYDFGNGNLGAYPSSGLIFDASGKLYGTAPSGGPAGHGTIFQLSPPPSKGDAWTATPLYSFVGGAAAAEPYADLAADGAGNFYGTTLGGGQFGYGTVFELKPSAAPGEWIATVLYSFAGGSDGALPYAHLIFDNAGNLYGTTFFGGTGCVEGCGTVFQLTPTNSSAWQERVIYRFQGGSDGTGPFAGLVMDERGTLYGTTIDGGAYGCGTAFGPELSASPSIGDSGDVLRRPFVPMVAGLDGTVFQLKPPHKISGVWTHTVLHSFGSGNDGANPYAGLTRDGEGNLYGTTIFGGNVGCGFAAATCGTVFEVKPPHTKGGAWREAVILEFPAGGRGGFGPYAGLALDGKGNFYGATEFGGDGTCNYGCGVVFRLKPPPGKNGGWLETVLHNFEGGSDGTNPAAGLILDRQGKAYGTTSYGGSGGTGTVFRIVP